VAHKRSIPTPRDILRVEREGQKKMEIFNGLGDMDLFWNNTIMRHFLRVLYDRRHS